MMDDTNNASNSSSQISSLLLGHLLSSSTSTSTSFAGVSHHHRARQMPFSSSSSSLPGLQAPSLFVPSCSGGAENAEGGDIAVAVSLGFDPAEFLHSGGRRRGTPAELDIDPYDGGESEEGVEVSEEPAKPATRSGSGSKRSRAAEVHNLSEKRRRSRINEKMKALQNLIPNSNKTDKASMLDEAIEYLKQLQLQVQMLAMRNGQSLHPMYLPGALQPPQASQMQFGMDNGSLMNIGVGMLPVNRDSSAQNSFDLSTRCTPSHPSVIHSVTNITNPETSFGMEASQSHHGSFHLTVPIEEIYTEDMVPQPRSEVLLSKDQENQVLMQHLHGLQTGRSFSTDDVKTETLEF